MLTNSKLFNSRLKFVILFVIIYFRNCSLSSELSELIPYTMIDQDVPLEQQM